VAAARLRCRPIRGKWIPPDLEARQQRFAASEEFAEQSALAQIGAGYAYARGATGAGETLVIVDSGLQENHREFAGKQLRVSGHPNSPGYRADVEQSSHGTATAGIAAARRDLDSAVFDNMHGVAFDADVHMVNIPLGSAPPTYTPFSLAAFGSTNDRYWESLLGYTAGLGAIVNLSLGYAGAISEPEYTRAEVRSTFARTAAAMAQDDTPDAEKSIFVFAAGNAGQAFTAAAKRRGPMRRKFWAGWACTFPSCEAMCSPSWRWKIGRALRGSRRSPAFPIAAALPGISASPPPAGGLPRPAWMTDVWIATALSPALLPPPPW